MGDYFFKKNTMLIRNQLRVIVRMLHDIFTPIYLWTSKIKVVKYSSIHAIVLIHKYYLPEMRLVSEEGKPFDVGDIDIFCLMEGAETSGTTEEVAG